MALSPDGPKDNMAPLFDLVLKHVEPPKVGAGRLPHARHAARGQSLSRAHHHRPCVLRLDPHQRAGQGHRPSGRHDRAGPGVANPCLPRHRAGADRRGGRRRHRRRRGVGKVQRRRHPVQPGGGRAADRPADRPADAVDDLFRQRQPARGNRGRQGDEPRHPRPPVEGGRGQCRAQGRAGAQFRRLCRLGARRIAARDPDRDHAPRGLRAQRLAAEGALSAAATRARFSSRSRRS